MSLSFRRLLRNRVTFFALPVAVVAIAPMLFGILVLNIDVYTCIDVILILVVLFLIGVIAWRIKFPLSFWNFYIFTEPYNARFYCNRATVYYVRCGAYEEALRDYTTGFQLEPEAKTLAALYSGRVALFSQMGRYEEALEDAARGLQISQTNGAATLLYHRGYVYQQLFSYEAALSDYEPVIAKSWLLAPFAHLSGGLIYAALGDYRRALSEEDACIRKRPHLPMGYTTCAMIHLKFFQYQNALEDAEKALQHDRRARLMTRQGGGYPYAAAIYAQRALAYCGLQNYQAALEDGQRAVELAPVYGPNWYGLGQIYLATNQIAQAIDAFQHGIEADPAYVGNAALLVWTRMDARLPVAGEAVFLHEAAQRYLQSEWGHLYRGMVSWLREDYTQAHAELYRAKELDVMNAHSYFWLAMLHASLAEDELATLMLRDAQRLKLARPLMQSLRYFEHKRPELYTRIREFLL